MAIFLILYVVVVTLVLTLVLPRLGPMTPRLRRVFTITAVGGAVVFGGVLWWALRG